MRMTGLSGGAGEGEGGIVLRQWRRDDRRDRKVTAPCYSYLGSREQRCSRWPRLQVRSQVLSTWQPAVATHTAPGCGGDRWGRELSRPPAC